MRVKVLGGGTYDEIFKDKPLTVPEEGIVMDRNEARDLLAAPSAMFDNKGFRTPKALVYACEICDTPFPPKYHTCFKESLEKLGLLDEPDACDFCGEGVTEKGGLDAHYDRKHKGLRPQVSEGTATALVASAASAEVSVLQGQVAALTQMVTNLLGQMVLQPKVAPAPPVDEDPTTDALRPTPRAAGEDEPDVADAAANYFATKKKPSK